MNPKRVVRKLLPGRAVHTAEESYRKGRIYALQTLKGFPARKLRIIGVTGTNGKTTTCALINAMLKSAGKRTAMFTTAVVEMDGQQTINVEHRTVPITSDLLNFLKTASKKKVDFVILEITSQALDQHKLLGIPVEIAVMTNLTQDHLDYHGTMEQYAAAKARLFNRYAKPKISLLNHDDEWFEFFEKESVDRVESYGLTAGSSLKISNITTDTNGSKFDLARGDSKTKFSTHLVGKFNVYNAAAAAGVGLLLGLEAKTVAKGVASLESVPGRMEDVDGGQDFSVIVDYAHGPDALEKVLRAVGEITKGKVIVVFGATGDRDKSKRPLMGKVVTQHADRIFLTDDETYSEDPEAIRQAVFGGIKSAGGDKKTEVISDRREAIRAAFKSAEKGDSVVLAGIGHQNHRVMAGKKEPWDERQIALEELKSPPKA